LSQSGCRQCERHQYNQQAPHNKPPIRDNALGLPSRKLLIMNDILTFYGRWNRPESTNVVLFGQSVPGAAIRQ
jgi:hypothetical protein